MISPKSRTFGSIFSRACGAWAVSNVSLKYPTPLSEYRLCQGYSSAGTGTITESRRGYVCVDMVNECGCLNIAIEQAHGLPADLREQMHLVHNAAAEDDFFRGQHQDLGYTCTLGCSLARSSASLSGKMVSLMINPIASVMLSYLGKKDTKDSRQFFITLIIGLFVGCFGYLACLLVSKTVLRILYPMYCEEALKYIFVTTGTAVTAAIISLINPFILRYKSMKWQVVINLSTVLFFFFICNVLSKGFGLFGFCFGTLICNLYRIILSVLIFTKKTNQQHVADKNENNKIAE